MTKFMLYEVGKNALKCDNVIHMDGTKKLHKYKKLVHILVLVFSNFSCMFLNPNIFFLI